MSHVAMATSQKTQIKSIEALQKACETLGLLCRQTERGKGHYRSWKDDHEGRFAGDYDLPAGMTAATAGDNADYVISLSPEQRKKIRRSRGADPYEIGVIWHEPDSCYYLAYDYFAGGYGLSEYVGEPVFEADGKTVKVPAPRLVQHYKAAFDQTIAQVNNHSLISLQMADGSLVQGSVTDFKQMGMLPPELVELLKDKSNLVSVIGA